MYSVQTTKGNLMSKFDISKQEAKFYYVTLDFELDEVGVECENFVHMIDLNNNQYIDRVNKNTWCHFINEDLSTILNTDEVQRMMDKIKRNAPTILQITSKMTTTDINDKEYIDFGAGCFVQKKDDTWYQWDGGMGIEVTEREVSTWLLDEQSIGVKL
jgi:hypothetical protein